MKKVISTVKDRVDQKIYPLWFVIEAKIKKRMPSKIDVVGILLAFLATVILFGYENARQHIIKISPTVLCFDGIKRRPLLMYRIGNKESEGIVVYLHDNE